FDFFIVDDPAINAFALPGGYIGVNVGLLLASETESELAGVLAHEVAHVTQRHIARSIYDTQRSSVLNIAAMLAAVLLGAATDAGSEATAGLITAAQAATIQRQINFTRANEHEADR
ncbi:MAG TPA: M48 family peptidase, partial [Planctomycetes bacterium]|nr:M48 family peptidase [Planctomycetota bacterium]